MFCLSGTSSWQIAQGNIIKLILGLNRDGIARVHGMNNVQAEELVECEGPT